MVESKFSLALHDPEELERLYHADPKQFCQWLGEAALAHPDSETVKVWLARLNYSGMLKINQSAHSIPFIVILSLLPGLLIKLPEIFPIPESWYIQHFSSWILFASLVAYFYESIESNVVRKIVLGSMGGCFLIALLLPSYPSSHSLVMAFIHLPLVLVSVLGIAFMGKEWRETGARLLYLRYLGEVFVYSVLILLGGAVLSSLTVSLFMFIGLDIGEWYSNYILVFGLLALPVVATYLYDGVLSRKSGLATLLANIFSPLFLITVCLYLLAVLSMGKSPYSDRDFLIVFNGLLLVVWGMTVFSIVGWQASERSRWVDRINMALVAVTLIINTIAFSAIMFRLCGYGVTPNRVVVTGANLLIFIHLVLILKEYIGYSLGSGEQKRVETAIGNYLPIYTSWSLFVVMVLPVLFWFK